MSLVVKRNSVKTWKPLPMFWAWLQMCMWSNRPEIFFGKGVLKICNKVTGEQPCQSVILIKLLSKFIEITLWHGCSLVNLLHDFRTTFWRTPLGDYCCGCVNKTNLHATNCSSRFLKDSKEKTSELFFSSFSVLFFIECAKEPSVACYTIIKLLNYAIYLDQFLQ